VRIESDTGEINPTCVPTSGGPVAQLGARFHGMEEVVGSNPTRSTITLRHFLGPVVDFRPRRSSIEQGVHPSGQRSEMMIPEHQAKSPPQLAVHAGRSERDETELEAINPQ
jgi:hypothetical protein